MRNILQKIDGGLAAVENVVIVLVLGIMVVLSFLQVLLRNFLDSGILWGDILLRHLVLWVGFVGASLATREEKHINIDILSRILPDRIQPYSKMTINFVTIVVCFFLARAGFGFLSYEIEANTILFENIPAWYFEVIIPVGFAMIGFRFLLKIFEQIAELNSEREP